MQQSEVGEISSIQFQQASDDLPSTPECILANLIDVWPGQRDGRGLFRHAVPGCFPDSKGVLWLGFCAWNSGIACQNLDFFIRFRSDVWPGQRDGRRLFRHAVPGCFPDSKGVFWLAFCAWNSGIACQNLSGVTFGPGRGMAGGCSVTPCQGVFLIRRVSCGLVSVPGTVEACARTLLFSFDSGVTFGPGRGTAAGCSVTPCQHVFRI